MRFHYRGLQLQFQRRLSAGLQALVSYTLGHSRDTSSSDARTNIPAELLPPEKDFGDSDFDVRHVLAAALTYQTPGVGSGGVVTQLTRNWGLDLMLRARSGFPYTIGVDAPFPPETLSARPNIVPGQSFWLEDPTVPGGRRLNLAAFIAPAPGTQGNLRRGAVRGFGARQVDLAIRREFGLPSRLRLQLRAEMFNLFNTPNFGDGTGDVRFTFAGVPFEMLNRALGGPRST